MQTCVNGAADEMVERSKITASERVKDCEKGQKKSQERKARDKHEDNVATRVEQSAAHA